MHSFVFRDGDEGAATDHTANLPGPGGSEVQTAEWLRRKLCPYIKYDCFQMRRSHPSVPQRGRNRASLREIAAVDLEHQYLYLEPLALAGRRLGIRDPYGRLTAAMAGSHRLTLPVISVFD